MTVTNVAITSTTGTGVAWYGTNGTFGGLSVFAAGYGGLSIYGTNVVIINSSISQVSHGDGADLYTNDLTFMDSSVDTTQADGLYVDGPCCGGGWSIEGDTIEHRPGRGHHLRDRPR